MFYINNNGLDQFEFEQLRGTDLMVQMCKNHIKVSWEKSISDSSREEVSNTVLAYLSEGSSGLYFYRYAGPRCMALYFEHPIDMENVISLIGHNNQSKLHAVSK